MLLYINQDVYYGWSLISGGLSDGDKVRFDAVRRKAADMGVREINFFGSEAKDSLVCYERTLEIIEKNKARYDRNAGEA